MFEKIINLVMILCGGLVMLYGISQGLGSQELTNAMLMIIFSFLVIRFC